MSKHVFEVKQKCQSCGGTGLYVGLAERDGAAVVCHSCKGTGCTTFRHEYEDFDRRAPLPPEVRRVYETNPGIVIGEGKGQFRLEDFGGMPVKEWEAGLPFPTGSENRKCTCPAWWYQTANYKLKPDWQECWGCGMFSQCKMFPNKHRCWEKFDAERAAK